MSGVSGPGGSESVDKGTQAAAKIALWPLAPSFTDSDSLKVLHPDCISHRLPLRTSHQVASRQHDTQAATRPEQEQFGMHDALH